MSGDVDVRECPICTFNNAFPAGSEGARCPICGWINDSSQRANPDLATGANEPMTLAQAQEARRAGWNVETWRMDHFYGHKKPSVKVRFRLTPANGWPPYETEGLWAEQLSEDTFRLDNIPWFVSGVSCGDIVRALPCDNGEHIFDSVLERGGHATYRIILNDKVNSEAEDVRSFFSIMKRLGCVYEGQDGRAYSVDVPPEADRPEVDLMMRAAQGMGCWTYEKADDGTIN